MNSKKKFIEIPDEAIIRDSSKTDIYYDNKIYIGHNGRDGLLNQGLTNYPVQGSHSFKDGQEVVEGKDYTTIWNGSIGDKSGRVAIPLPTPAPVETGRMNKQQVKDYFDAVGKMGFKMPVAELPKEAEGKDCEHGYRGSCCCNCKNQIKLMCHPWNKDFGKGSISEQCGWVCTMQFSDGSNKGQGVFFFFFHGMCEMHCKR